MCSYIFSILQIIICLSLFKFKGKHEAENSAGDLACLEKSLCSLTPNAVLPPDHVTTAEKIHSTSTTQKSHLKNPPCNSQATATYTLSVHRHAEVVSTLNYQAALPIYTVTWLQ